MRSLTPRTYAAADACCPGLTPGLPICRVEAALAKHPDSPWLLGGDRPSIVDLQYIRQAFGNRRAKIFLDVHTIK